MTTSDDRLDRIEALLDRVAQQQAAHNEVFNHMQDQQLAHNEAFSRLQDQQSAHNEAFSRLQDQQLAHNEAFSRLQDQQSTTDDIIRSSITDVVEMISDLGRQQQETDQRFNTLLADARADRLRADADAQENRRDHREFRTFMRETLQELRRI